MYGSVKDEIAATLQEIKDAGLYKNERELTSPQSAHITTRKAEALNFCANNYLGLANDPGVVAASKRALDEWGFGMASVRFICGTQTLHTSLERQLSEFLGTEATILYSSCFDANGGVFEVLFGASVPRNSLILCSSEVCSVWVPQMKRTDAMPKPHSSSAFFEASMTPASLARPR